MSKIRQQRSGFSLLETIIYIGLFTLLFGTVLSTVHPIFTSTERLTKAVTTETEVAFMLAKIEYQLKQALSSPAGSVEAPPPSTSSSTLALRDKNGMLYTFSTSNAVSTCLPPRVCEVSTLALNNNEPLPLTSSRVNISNFLVTHTPPNPTEQSSRTIDISFDVNNKPVRPLRFYVQF